MSIASKSSRVLMAAAAAALFAGGAGLAPSAAEAARDYIKCMGTNACKGQGACQTATSGCKGLNACKGQGWVPTSTVGECRDMGGTPS